MITKTTIPMITTRQGKNIVIGTQTEYRLFGLLLCRKILYEPSACNAEGEYIYRI